MNNDDDDDDLFVRRFIAIDCWTWTWWAEI